MFYDQSNSSKFLLVDKAVLRVLLKVLLDFTGPLGSSRPLLMIINLWVVKFMNLDQIVSDLSKLGLKIWVKVFCLEIGKTSIIEQKPFVLWWIKQFQFSFEFLCFLESCGRFFQSFKWLLGSWRPLLTEINLWALKFTNLDQIASDLSKLRFKSVLYWNRKKLR